MSAASSHIHPRPPPRSCCCMQEASQTYTASASGPEGTTVEVGRGVGASSAMLKCEAKEKQQQQPAEPRQHFLRLSGSPLSRPPVHKENYTHHNKFPFGLRWCAARGGVERECSRVPTSHLAIINCFNKRNTMLFSQEEAARADGEDDFHFLLGARGV